MEYNKIWLCDKTVAPDNYYRADTVNKAKNCIIYNEQNNITINEINIANKEIEYARQADGGSISDFLSWLINTNRNYTVVYHECL